MPVQTIRGGEVRLVVSEGRYGKVSIRGNRYYSTRFIERLFSPALEAGRVYAPSLYRSLLLLNEYSDLQVQALFNPSRQKGTTDVVLAVKDSRPVHVGLDYNNYGNRLVGRNRVGTVLTAGDALLPGDEFLLRAVDSWPGRSHIFWNAGYVTPVGRRGTKVGVQFADVETHVRGRDLDVLDINGDANIVSLTATHPLVRSLAVVANLTANLTAKTVRNFAQKQPLGDDELRSVSFGHDGARGDRKGRWVHAVNVTQGLGTLLGGIANGDPQGGRALAGAGNAFTKTNLDVIRTQDLKKNRFALARLSAQTSSRPLPAAEQFGIGGPDSVRGFIQSELVADSGFTLSAEYRQQVWQWRDRVVQAVGFMEHGYGELKRPQLNEERHRSLTGLGVGARASFGSDMSLRADLGVPISSGRNADGDDVLLYVQAATRY